MKRERDKLDKTLGGIREMGRTPSAVWIVDTNKEHLAVEEARKLRIPIIAILDSNCDPDVVDYPIPGNDDAIRAVGLLTRVVADAVADGLIARSGAKTEGEEKAIGADEPLADWERDLLAGSRPTRLRSRRPVPPPMSRVPPPRRPRPPRRPEPPPRRTAAAAVAEAPAEAPAAAEEPAEAPAATEAPAEAAAERPLTRRRRTDAWRSPLPTSRSSAT